MKYLRAAVYISTALFLSACGGAKTEESVFPGTTYACGQEAEENRFIVQWEDGRFTVETANSAEDFRRNFVSENLAFIKHVDHDYRIHLSSQDFLSILDEGAVESSTMNWGTQNIGAQTLWNQGINGSGVLVGVVDGMVDVGHPQLSGNIAINTGEIQNNGVDDDGNGFIDDYKGVQVNQETNDPRFNRHGSHVAGIVVADSAQGPVSGVAQRAKVIPAQFIANDGGGSIGDAIIALNYVADRGAKIINMSWGMESCVAVPNLQSTLQDLNNRGLLLVTAAGNGDSRGVGVNMDTKPAFPSAYNFANQLNVAASTTSNFLIGFSNYGLRSVHVAAPGVGIYSTTPSNQVESMSGTSMAAPMVAGAAALLWQAVPSASAAQIKQSLITTVTRPSSPLQVVSGGVINLPRALTELRRLTGQ